MWYLGVANPVKTTHVECTPAWSQSSKVPHTAGASLGGRRPYTGSAGQHAQMPPECDSSCSTRTDDGAWEALPSAPYQSPAMIFPYSCRMRWRRSSIALNRPVRNTLRSEFARRTSGHTGFGNRPGRVIRIHTNTHIDVEKDTEPYRKCGRLGRAEFSTRRNSQVFRARIHAKVIRELNPVPTRGGQQIGDCHYDAVHRRAEVRAERPRVYRAERKEKMRPSIAANSIFSIYIEYIATTKIKRLS